MLSKIKINDLRVQPAGQPCNCTVTTIEANLTNSAWSDNCGKVCHDISLNRFAVTFNEGKVCSMVAIPC